MARVRTINQVIKHIKEVDGGSAITEWALRRLVKTGRIKHIMVGNRALIDLDSIDELFIFPAEINTLEK